MGNTLKCNWQDGLGTSPTGEQCGECNPEFAKHCPALNKEKQIEEMVAVISEKHNGGWKFVNDSEYTTDVYNEELAEHLYNAGYRKASEVAREIERYLRINEDIAIRCKAENGEQNEEYWKGKLSAFRQIRGFIGAELKKKHTEEKSNAT